MYLLVLIAGAKSLLNRFTYSALDPCKFFQLQPERTIILLPDLK
jgi:hypothetical protein